MSTLSQIENLKEQLDALSDKHRDVTRLAQAAEKNRRSARWRANYFAAILSLRKPAERYAMWNTGVLIVGPAMAMLLGFLLFTILGLSGSLIFWLILILAAVVFAVLLIMLNFPATSELPKRIADARFLATEFQGEATKLTEELATLTQKTALTKSTIQEMRQADVQKREQLLERNWKSMRDDEWDHYVAEVFAALGAQAELMPDKAHGIDLLVRYGAIMIAVESQGFVGAVDIDAIKQAIAGREHYGCDRAAVITNSRFTAPARAFAASHRCFLIGEQEFPAFVLGSNLELFN